MKKTNIIQTMKFINFLLEENKNILKILNKISLNEVTVPQLGIDPRNKNKINVKQAEKKLSHKELTLWERMKKNWKKIALAAAGIGLVGIGLYGYYNTNKVEKIKNTIPKDSPISIKNQTSSLKDKPPLSEKEQQEIKKTLEYGISYIKELTKNIKNKTVQSISEAVVGGVNFNVLSINSLYQLKGFIVAIKEKLLNAQETDTTRSFLKDCDYILDSIKILEQTIAEQNQEKQENIIVDNVIKENLRDINQTSDIVDYLYSKVENSFNIYLKLYNNKDPRKKQAYDEFIINYNLLKKYNIAIRKTLVYLNLSYVVMDIQGKFINTYDERYIKNSNTILGVSLGTQKKNAEQDRIIKLNAFGYKSKDDQQNVVDKLLEIDEKICKILFDLNPQKAYDEMLARPKLPSNVG